MLKQQVPRHNFSRSASPLVIHSRSEIHPNGKVPLNAPGCWRETISALTRLCLCSKTRSSACAGRGRHERLGGSWLRARPRFHRSAGLSSSVCLRQPTLGGVTKGRVSGLPFFFFVSDSPFVLPLSETHVEVDLLGRCASTMFTPRTRAAPGPGKSTPRQKRRHASDLIKRTFAAGSARVSARQVVGGWGRGGVEQASSLMGT